MMKITVARYLSLLSYLGLFAYMMWWVIELSNQPAERISFMLLIAVSPLLITLRGVLHTRDKSLIWSSLICLLYLVHGGVVWWSDADLSYWGLLELSLATIHILSSSFYIRWRTDAVQQPSKTA